MTVGLVRDSRTTNGRLTRYTFGTWPANGSGPRRSARVGPAILRILASTDAGSAFGR
jgi:hypothetical protein